LARAAGTGFAIAVVAGYLVFRLHVLGFVSYILAGAVIGEVIVRTYSGFSSKTFVAAGVVAGAAGLIAGMIFAGVDPTELLDLRALINPGIAVVFILVRLGSA
jgi:membrane-associated protease RseP (regulator of RpoE activity)